jgi:hypothetical protein
MQTRRGTMGRGPNDGLYRRIEKLCRERDTLNAEAAALWEKLAEARDLLEEVSNHCLGCGVRGPNITWDDRCDGCGQSLPSKDFLTGVDDWLAANAKPCGTRGDSRVKNIPDRLGGELVYGPGTNVPCPDCAEGEA